MTSSQTDPFSASELIWDQQQNGGSSREVLHVIINVTGAPRRRISTLVPGSIRKAPIQHRWVLEFQNVEW